MDKLAPIIGWMKRNKFWIGSSLLSILMLVGWYLASSSMQEAKSKQIREYTSSFSKIKSIKKVAAVTVEDGAAEKVVAHPNSTTEEKMLEQLEATADAVVKAWKIKRERQEPLMQFSKELLGEDTYQFLANSKAPELLTNGEHFGTQNEKYLKMFRQQIPKKVSQIARHVRANWEYDEERIEAELRREAKEREREEFGAGGFLGGGIPQGGFMGGMEIDTERNKYAVIWDKANQDLWRSLLTEFQNWDDNAKASVDPTLLQVHMVQQDVWFLEAMFDLIRQINGNATTNDLAVIKDIHHIAFGREARADLGVIMEADSRLGGAKMITENENVTDFSEVSSFDPGFGDVGETGPVEFDINADESPFHGRYVNVNLEPINAVDVRNAVGGDALPETNLELVVTKRVPFRLSVKMDERKINAFLALCANSPFEFEVLQLRINRDDELNPIVARGGKTENKSAASIEGMFGGAGMEAMMGEDLAAMAAMSAMMDGGMNMGPEAQQLKALEPSAVETRLSYDVDVEFYGVVKIYNPVRERFLREAIGLPVEGENEDSGDAGLDAVAVREL